MPDVISFSEAIARTDGKDRSLLIGNGFSAQYFSYADLLGKSGIVDAQPGQRYLVAKIPRETDVFYMIVFP